MKSWTLCPITAECILPKLAKPKILSGIFRNELSKHQTRRLLNFYCCFWKAFETANPDVKNKRTQRAYLASKNNPILPLLGEEVVASHTLSGNLQPQLHCLPNKGHMLKRARIFANNSLFIGWNICYMFLALPETLRSELSTSVTLVTQDHFCSINASRKDHLINSPQSVRDQRGYKEKQQSFPIIVEWIVGPRDWAVQWTIFNVHPLQLRFILKP